MSVKFIIIFFFLFVAAFTNFTKDNSLNKNAEAITCSPNTADDAVLSESGKYIDILPGWGNYSYTISTANDSAQLYFNQGLTLYYSYHAKEATASFKEAARFDNGSAMAYWGQALAMGPTYNGAHLYKTSPSIKEIIAKMNVAAPNAPAKEQELITIMNSRYNINDLGGDRTSLNQSWSDGLKDLSIKYPGDIDIKALYVDAVMLQHPWDFWQTDGKAKPWAPGLINFTEEILNKYPLHPAALHYYIHLTEASKNPETVFNAADKLKTLFPGVAHMVHMSSHLYERNGMYENGVAVNEKADAGLQLYDSLAPQLSLAKHSSHYFAVSSYCALSGAMYTSVLPLYYKCRKSLSPSAENTYHQYLYMLPQMAMVRMGKWDDILRDTTNPDAAWPYAIILNEFAKGMAYTSKGNLQMANDCLAHIRQKKNDSSLAVYNIPFNKPLSGTIIAEHILQSSILFTTGKQNDAITAIKKAIAAEDSLIYSEPRDWMLPARQYLGYYLLKMNKPAAAGEVYRKDLIENPGNGWSALGLYQSLLQQKKKKGSVSYKAIYLQSFSAADVIPPYSVYQ